MRDAVVVQELGKPAVAAVTEHFVPHARTIANVEGHPKLRSLVFPYPLEGLPERQVLEIAAAWYPKFLDLLGAVQ